MLDVAGDPSFWRMMRSVFSDFDWLGHSGYVAAVVLLAAFAAYYWVRVSRRVRRGRGASKARKLIAAAIAVLALVCVCVVAVWVGSLSGTWVSLLKGIAMRAIYFHGPAPPFINAEKRDLQEAFATGFWGGAGATIASFALLAMLLTTVRLALAWKRLAPPVPLAAEREDGK